MATRLRLERLQGIAFDAILVAVAVAAAEDVVQDWLLSHSAALYHGLAVLHAITCPALLVAIIAGYGKPQTIEELNDRGPSLRIWAFVMLWGGSFVIPGVLGLLLDPPEWEMVATTLGPPLVVFPAWVAALVAAERRGWIAPEKLGAPKPARNVQALALLAWAYLLWVETMLLVAAGQDGPLSQVGIPIGVLINYLPIRVVIYYVRNNRSRWEVLTIAASVIHLLYRIGAA